jgi:hypothetical protein
MAAATRHDLKLRGNRESMIYISNNTETKIQKELTHCVNDMKRSQK